jgi:large repetitive protein
MKLKNYLQLVVLLFISTTQTFGQGNKAKGDDNSNKNINASVPFVTRMPGFPAGNIKVKGDVVFVGNQILNKTATLPTGFNASGEPNNLAALTLEANTPLNNAAFNGGTNNGQLNFEYIDIDGDPTTFSSSSADLALKNPNGSVNTCKRIRYAALYWAAFYPYERSTDANANYTGTPTKPDWNTIKFKVPGGTYQTLTADANPDPVGDEDEIVIRDLTQDYLLPYVCYKNVTSLFTAMETAGVDTNGTYTVANQRVSRGQNNTGMAGGWTLVIIYESPSFPSKYITVFDGYQLIQAGNGPLDYVINGFQTLPAPFPVRAKVGVAALEGEIGLTGDTYSIKSNPSGTFSTLSNAVNPANSFFNSSISEPIPIAPFAAYVTTRNPNSTNTLGFDLDQVNVPNPTNSVIPNGTTSATVRLTSVQDSYAPYLQTFAVDIIEPKILVTKTVKDTAGNPVTNVTLGQSLVYDITYQNLGNDDATNFTIKDILPINLIPFNLSDLTLPAGVTATYSNLPAGTGGTVTFTIPNNQVRIGDPFQTIQIRVKIVSTCNQLVNACSNIIKNQAFATYSGALNTAQITDDPSIASFTLCNVQPASTTNFLVGVTGCVFTQNVQLCGDSVTITAASGYNTHVWTTIAPSPQPSSVLIPNTTGNPQSITLTAAQINALLVSGVATIYVLNDGANPCLPSVEVISITPFALSSTLHPVRPATGLLATIPASPTDIDSIAVCSSLGTETPIINLCGSGDTRTITTGITGAVVKWYRLDTVASGCPLGTLNCPRSLLSEVPCWNASPPVFTGPTYSVSTAGQYRIVVTYGNGCSNTFYFNVFKNDFNPFLLSKTDIICGNPPQITIGGVPSNGQWQFSLQPAGPFQSSNVFSPTSAVPISGTTAANYTVYVSQVGNGLQGCRFTIPVTISIRNLTTTATVTNALCFGGQGSVNIAANGVSVLNASGVETTQYNYTIFNSLGAQVANSGLTTSNFYSLTSTPAAPTLVAGCYTYTVTTSNGCNVSGNFCITSPPLLTATITETQRVTSCSDGQITVIPSGGTPPYNYAYTLNGNPISGASSSFSPEQYVITVPIAGQYNYSVVITDFNNCTITKTITVVPLPPPVFNVSPTVPVACYGTPSSSITVNVTNFNQATLKYSITPGAPLTSFVPGTATGYTFSGLTGGTYPLVIQYTVGTSVCYTPVQNIVIAQPFAALTASGGVTALACGTPSLGTVAITNPQGGTLPYTYNFNNGVGPYIASNTAQVPPGSYTICIKDAAGCTFCIPVIIDPQPNPPTIVVSNTSFNCNGSSTVTATITNQSSNNNYTYILDNNPPNTGPTPNVFTNVPTGSHTICVNYTPTLVPTYSNLLFEDFGIGANTTTPGIASAYCFNNQQLPSTCPNPTQGLEDNQYVVTSAINPNNGAWFQFRDHTSASPGPINPNGRFLAVNIGGAAGSNGILYSKNITSVIPNQPIIVEAYLANLLRANLVGGSDPSFVFEIRNGGTLLAQSPVLPATDPILRSDTWQLKSVTLNPGPGPFPLTGLTFNILSGSTDYNGNDCAIDDIKVYQLPQLCTTQRCFPVIVPAGNAFSAQFVSSTNVTCNGANNATVTIAAQNYNTTNGYFYTVNGGAPIPASTPTVTFNVPVGTVNISVLFDATSTVGNCQINLAPITITQPAPLVTTAVVTPATCLQAATITASAVGGTAAYSYQLVTFPGNASIPAFPVQPNNPVFLNVPAGSYTVITTDSKGCTDPTDTAVIVLPVATLSATISPLSDFCFDTVNAATLTVVPVGVGPFTYTLNGNAVTNPIAISTPGTKTIIVTDTSTGCTFTLPVINIAPQLSVSLVETQSLRCNTVPALTEIITGTVAGGYPGTSLVPALTYDYTYQVSTVSGPPVFGPPVPFTGTTFIYNSTLTTATNYVFLIKDGRGCQVQSNTFQVPAVQYPTGTSTETQVVCFGTPTGSITITPSGGVGPYTITLTPQAPLVGAPTTSTSNPATFSGLLPGTYTYVITSTTTGCASQGVLSQTVTNLALAPVTSTVTAVPLGCITNSGPPPVLGQVCITAVSGGIAPYTYTITDLGGFSDTFLATTGANHCFTGLGAGIYTAVVTDSRGCKKTTIVTISSPVSGISLVVTPVPATCGASGSVVLHAELVAPAVAYSPPGCYYFAVYTPAGPPVFFVQWPNAIYQTPTAAEDAIWGAAPYNYAPGTTTTITGLTPGVNYQFVIYDTCTPSSCYVIQSGLPAPLAFTDMTATVVPHNVSCKGNNDGYVQSFTLSGYNNSTPAPAVPATSVSYQVFNNSTNLPVVGLSGTSTGLTGAPITVTLPFGCTTGLAPGQYYIKFTLNNGSNVGCTDASQTFIISESTFALTATVVKIKNANCNNLAGQIQITPSFGTAPYTFLSLPTGTPVPASIPVCSPAWVAFLATINLTNTVINANAGTYDVYIKDANDCVIVRTVTVPTDPLPTIDPIVVTNQCTSTTNLFDFTTTGTGIAPLTYILTPGSPTFGSGVFNNITPGTYTVTIKDGNGCTATRPVTIYPQLIFNPQPLVLPTCILNNDGSIVLNTSGGSGTFTYTLNPPLGTFVAGSPASFTGLPAGPYAVTITDTTTNCPPKTVNVTLIAPTPVTLLPATITNTSCFGPTSTDGAFTVNLVTPTAVVNNNPIYTYTITAFPAAYTGPTTGGPTFNNLPAGSYTVRVTSGRLCFVDQVIVVGQPALIVVAPPVVTQFGCSANSNTPSLAQINANPVAGAITGGSGVYVNYQFIGPAPSTNSLYSGPNPILTVGNFAGGTYTVIVTDSKGCKGTITCGVNPFIGITNGSVTVTTPITCTNLQNMTVNVNPAPLGSGIVPPNITYTLVGVNGTTFGPVSQPSPNFSNLIVGDYAITILNNATGCSIVINHYVFNPNTFDLVIPVTTPVSCFGGNNGSATVTIVDNSINLTAIPPDPDNAGPFTYTYQQGTITGSVFTGLFPPSALLTSPNAGPVSITGLSAGTYQVIATLSGSPGCSVTKYFTIGGPSTAFALNPLTITPVTCNPTNNGTITVTAQGGWGNYTYQITPAGSNPAGFTANNYFTGLSAGVLYTINVRDTTSGNATPCVLTLTQTLSAPVPLTATATATPLLLPCFGSQTASISVFALNGAGPGTYTYVLNNVSIPTTQLTNSPTNPITNPFFNGLGAGTYNVTVTDTWGCTFTTTPNIVIAQPTIVTPSLALTTPQTCAVPTLATLTISASNGTPPYRFATSATGPFTGPTFAASTTVQVPPSATPYQYWVIDANNCLAVATNSVPVNPLVPLSITVSPTSVTSISCNGSASGVIYTSALGGNAGATYSFTLTNTIGGPLATTTSPNPNATGTFTGLVAGTYYVRVTSGDCIITSPAINIVNSNPPLSFGVVVPSNILCTGAANGSVTINATGGFGIIKYAITYNGPTDNIASTPPTNCVPNSNSYDTVNTFTNLAQGQYVVNIQDQLGCTLNYCFEILEPTPVIASVGSVITQAYCAGDTATFNMNVTGGTPPYSYSVGNIAGPYTTGIASPVQNAFIVPVLNGGNQTIYIKDANGCATTASIVLIPAVTINPIATVSYNCPNDPTINFVTVSVAASANGLVTYSLDGGPFLPTYTSFTNLIPGLHYINVRSTVVNNLCTIRVNFNVIAIPGLSMTLANGTLNQIIATVTGGTPPYTYDFNGVNTGNVNSYIITQDFNGNVTATDANGCPVVVPFIKKFIDILIPNYFTPTGDGINDGWGPRNTANYKNLVTYVFDRYGRKIITLKEGEFWNGKYNGIELPSGDYWYVVKVDGNNGDREFVGNVTLYR